MGAVNKRPLDSKRGRSVSSRSSETEPESTFGVRGPCSPRPCPKRQKKIVRSRNIVKLCNAESKSGRDDVHDVKPSIDTTSQESRSASMEFDLLAIATTTLNRKEQSRIYNFGCRQKPAELFRKDLISAMKLSDSEPLDESDYILITDPWKEEWEKGVQVPVNPDALPRASFRISNAKLDCDDNRDQSTSRDHKMPREWIQHNPDGNINLEYELDLIDLSWRQVMAEKTCVPPIPESLIEATITELECQCAENMKESKEVALEYSQTVVCDVCRSPHGEDSNEMIFCDNCQVCVHQACYGVPQIPDGEWYCQVCELGKTSTASCILCPNRGGAMRRTPDGQFAHVSCSLWVVSQHADSEYHRESQKKSPTRKTKRHDKRTPVRVAEENCQAHARNTDLKCQMTKRQTKKMNTKSTQKKSQKGSCAKLANGSELKRTSSYARATACPSPEKHIKKQRVP